MKRVWLWAAALWFVSAGIWTVVLGVDVYYQVTPGWLMILHGVTAVTSWVAALANYGRYKKQERE